MAAQINLAPPTFLPAATPGKPTKAAAKAAAAAPETSAAPAPEIAAIAPLAAEPVVVEKLVTDPALVAKVAALGESLATVEERNVELTEEVAAKKESIDAMQIVLTSMQKREHELVARETTLTEAHEAASLSSAEATSTNASLAMQVEASAAKLEEATAAATAATASMATMQAELNAVQAELMELRAKMTELAELEASNAALQTAKAALVAKESVDAAQIAALMEQLAAAQADVAAEKATNAAQAAFVAGAEEQVNAIKGRALAAEKARTKIHDELMEVRGNIRVFCRMRPAAASAAAFDEDAAEFLFPDDCVDEIDEISDMAHCGRNMVLIQKSKDSQGKTLTKENEFAFDGILGPACDQETAFNCAPAAMIQSALDGKNACIFAYGQTGSGKTHTMTGTTEAPGVIPRALQFLFNGCDLLATRGWSHTVSMQMVEIYNESLVDLLHEEGAAPCAISVRHLPNYTEVAGARSVDVANAAEAMSMLALADVNRTVGQTDCNAHSSRSHSVCIVRIRGMRGERSRWSTLNLVDLAGSERLSKSGAGRDATLLKETQAINKSLSTLGNVMSCLLEKGRAHIPFRNSKLTYLLQKSLQDKSKVLMIACLSPQPEHAPETKCTLHFATKVNKVTMS